jgi:hypothetical protein
MVTNVLVAFLLCQLEALLKVLNFLESYRLRISGSDPVLEEALGQCQARYRKLTSGRITENNGAYQ